MRFNLVAGRHYAMELIGPEFGPDIRHHSPIEVHSISPAGGGKRLFELSFYHAAYPDGVRDKVYTVETIERSRYFLLGRVLGADRLIFLTELTEDWLQQFFPLLLAPAPREEEEHRQQDEEFDAKAVYGVTSPEDFIEFHWKADVLGQHGLPDIAYPVPRGATKAVLSGHLDVGFKELLYWLQQYVSNSGVPWRHYLPSMQRLAELLTQQAGKPEMTVQGDRFWLEVGPVDLEHLDLVTIQREGELIGAFQRREDGSLRFMALQPLDAKAIGYAIGLSARPGKDGSVCLRPDNWEYALDCSAGMGNHYANTAGECYLSRWEFGLGILADRSRDESWYCQRVITAIEPKYIVQQIGVHALMKQILDYSA